MGQGIAVLPTTDVRFEKFIRDAGGVPAPLSADTEGIVWLDARNPDALARVLDTHPGVRWVQLPFAGVENFVRVFRSGITWTSAKGSYAEPVAEFALALTLAVMRELPRRARATSWDIQRGESLFDRKILIVGAGGIAREYIRLIAPFRPEVTVVRRSAEPVPGAARTVVTGQFDQVLPDADVVVLAAAMTGNTRHLIDADALARMKQSAYLINVARGQLVDTDALVAALEAGSIAGAGIDVTDPEPLPEGHPLWRAPGALVTPHTADTWEMCVPLLGSRIEANVRAYLGLGEFDGIVDIVAGY